MEITPVRKLSDAELLVEVERIVQRERHATVVLILHLAEIEHRGLYLRQGYSSMFSYCVHGLHLSEYAAYHRIEAARLVVRFPAVLAALECGSLHLAAVRQLAPVLTAENHIDLLAAVQHKSKREIAELIAARCPRPAVVPSIRKVASRRGVVEVGVKEAATGAATGVAAGAATSAATGAGGVSTTADSSHTQTEARDAGALGKSSPGAEAEAFALSAEEAPQGARRKADVVPLGAQRYKVQFMVGAATHDKLRRAQELLRHRIPNGDVAAVIDQALDSLVRDLEKKKFGATVRPRRVVAAAPEGRAKASTPSSTSAPLTRHVPAHVKREVWQRDEGRCAFTGANGVRCTERAWLEFDHVRPFADGGPATVENVRLLCRQHNQYEARQFFGLWQNDNRSA